MTPTINPDLRSLIPSLTAEEYAQLEANLPAEGCRDPLVVWQEEQILLDGHNRLEICDKHRLPYEVHEVSLPDMDAAKLWMYDNQLGRRNLTSAQTSYYRGKQYELHKQVGFKGNQYASASGNSCQKHDTAKMLAAQHHVAEKTIRNDAAYAKAIDTLDEAVGAGTRQALLARDTKMTQQDVKTLAKIGAKYGHTAKKTLDAVAGAKTPKQARQIVRHAVREHREHEEWMARMIRSEMPEDEWPASLRPAPEKPVEEQAWEKVYETELGYRLKQALHQLGLLGGQLATGRDSFAETLPAILERSLKPWRNLGACWHAIERGIECSDILSETLYHVRTLKPILTLSPRPDIAAVELVDIMGAEYAQAVAQELLTMLCPVPVSAPAPPEPETPPAPPVIENSNLPISPVALSPIETHLLAHLTAIAPEGCTGKQGATAIGKKHESTTRAWQNLEKKGLVRKEDGRYVLAAAQEDTHE
jgi:hypothetical protein